MRAREKARRRSTIGLVAASAMIGALIVTASTPAVAADGDHVPILLSDVNPGTASSTPQRFVPLGAKVLFPATDAAIGREWRTTDGTPGGTGLVKDVVVGGQSGVSGGYAVAGGRVYFAGAGGSGGVGTELMRSDGTEAGTELVKDIRPGGGSSLGSGSCYGTNGTTVYFAADDGATGPELWKSDGTWDGTVLVKDINPGSFKLQPVRLHDLGQHGAVLGQRREHRELRAVGQRRDGGGHLPAQGHQAW